MLHKSLFEMTKQKTGIVIYHESEIIVCDWSDICSEGGLPFFSADQQLVNKDVVIECDDVYTSFDIRRAISGKINRNDPTVFIGSHILYDEYGSIPALWGYDVGKGAILHLDHNNRPISIGGTVYILHDGTKVIAPDDWP